MLRFTGVLAHLLRMSSSVADFKLPSGLPGRLINSFLSVRHPDAVAFQRTYWTGLNAYTGGGASRGPLARIFDHLKFSMGEVVVDASGHPVVVPHLGKGPSPAPQFIQGGFDPVTGAALPDSWHLDHTGWECGELPLPCGGYGSVEECEDCEEIKCVSLQFESAKSESKHSVRTLRWLACPPSEFPQGRSGSELTVHVGHRSDCPGLRDEIIEAAASVELESLRDHGVLPPESDWEGKEEGGEGGEVDPGDRIVGRGGYCDSDQDEWEIYDRKTRALLKKSPFDVPFRSGGGVTCNW